MISTHTPRVGCNLQVAEQIWQTCAISTHTPRMGCNTGKESTESILFQLIHPVWGVTEQQYLTVKQFAISTHTPRMWCNQNVTGRFRSYAISTHTPRMWCNWTKTAVCKWNLIFQLIHPVCGVTANLTTIRLYSIYHLYIPYYFYGLSIFHYIISISFKTFFGANEPGFL